MDALTALEVTFGKSRDQWKLEEWKAAAHELAGLPLPEKSKRGRRRGETIPGNIELLSFWAQEQHERAAACGETITVEESIKRVIDATASRQGLTQGRADAKLASGIRQVRHFRSAKKAENK